MTSSLCYNYQFILDFLNSNKENIVESDFINNFKKN